MANRQELIHEDAYNERLKAPVMDDPTVATPGTMEDVKEDFDDQFDPAWAPLGGRAQTAEESAFNPTEGHPLLDSADDNGPGTEQRANEKRMKQQEDHQRELRDSDDDLKSYDDVESDAKALEDRRRESADEAADSEDRRSERRSSSSDGSDYVSNGDKVTLSAVDDDEDEDEDDLNSKGIGELRSLASDANIEGRSSMGKGELVAALEEAGY